MPKGTRVARCVTKVKKSGRDVNPYAVCQASTKQSYATGKKIMDHTVYHDMGYLMAEAFGLLEYDSTKELKDQLGGRGIAKFSSTGEGPARTITKRDVKATTKGVKPKGGKKK